MSDARVQLPVPGVTPAAVSTRYGVKGAVAAQWLAQRGVAIPALANSVSRWAGGRCLRLGSTEFLVERDAPVGPDAVMAPTAFDDTAARGEHESPLSQGSDGDVEGAWLLLRSDHSIVLSSSLWPAALAQACSFDFTRLRDEPNLVVMTLFAGIAVTVIRESPGTSDYALRVWCDATYASYLNECLQRLARSPENNDEH